MIRELEGKRRWLVLVLLLVGAVVVGLVGIGNTTASFEIASHKALAMTVQSRVPCAGNKCAGEIAAMNSIASCAQRVCALAMTGESLQAAGDVALKDLIISQAVDGEPLIVGKQTVVRAVVGSSASDSVRVQVNVDYGGKTYVAGGEVQGDATPIDVFVDPPSEVKTMTVHAEIEPTGDFQDADPSNNAKTVSVPVIKPNQKIVAYFMPVDWTADQMARYDFQTAFPKFVEANGEYLRGAYPLASDQLELDYTLTPHLLAADEKRLANNQGNEDIISLHLLYASVALAAHRLRPDATLVVGVFPPGWFAKHGNPNTLGLALKDVKGTVTAQFVLSDATTSAHELAHLFWLYEDYDFSVKPPKNFTWLDRSGYWVEAHKPENIAAGKKIPTFLSAYSPTDPSWVDTRIYEYLMAKFTINTGGETSEPMVLAATMARQVETGGKNYPSDYAAGFQRFEPEQPVYVSVGVAKLAAGQKLEARWYDGDKLVYNASKPTTAGSGWYAFSLPTSSASGEGDYRVEIYLDGKLEKTTYFTVKSGR